jgi:Rod binding domain-containing protein
MAWTYDAALATDKDRVRFLCGDTDGADPQAHDEEIAFALSSEGGLYGAAAAVCEHLAARYARQAAKSAGEFQIALNQKHQQFLSTARQLRSRAASHAVPTAGGLSVSAKQALDANPDRTAPSFWRGMHEN